MTPKYVSNIIEVYHSATAAQHSDGVMWYRRANEFASDLASRYGCSLEVASGIIATLSPGLDWPRNQRDAESTIDAFSRGIRHTSKRFPKGIGVYGKNNIRKSELIWENLHTPSGLKVSSFAACIIDPLNDTSVVIDRHAYAVATRVLNGDLKLTPNQYERIAGSYRTAAKDLVLLPLELQAVTWVVWRERKGLK